MFLADPDRQVVGASTLVVVATDTVDTTVLRDAVPALLLGGPRRARGRVRGRVVARAAAHPARFGEIERAAAQLATGDLTGARRRSRPRPTTSSPRSPTTLNDDGRAARAARGSERAFLLSISHDLRTPLTSIRGYAEALADGTLDDADPDERKRAATVIGAEARRLERLVRDLLDLSRLDSHQFSLQSATVRRDRGRARRRRGVRAAGARARYPTDASRPGAVLPVDLDPERLAQIVANLVENALKYATSQVEVYARRRTDPGTSRSSSPTTVPASRPTGSRAVFDRLYTVRETPGRSVGTGLGLAIVRELAAAMGGRAWVDATTGGGTRFVVSLPTGTQGTPP